MASAPTVQIFQLYKCFSITQCISISISLFPFVGSVLISFVTLSISLTHTHTHTQKPQMLSCAHLTSCIFAILNNHNRTEISISLEQNGTRHSHCLFSFQLKIPQSFLFIFSVSSYNFRPNAFRFQIQRFSFVFYCVQCLFVFFVFTLMFIINLFIYSIPKIY